MFGSHARTITYRGHVVAGQICPILTRFTWKQNCKENVDLFPVRSIFTGILGLKMIEVYTALYSSHANSV